MDEQIQAHQPPPASQEIMASKPVATADDESNPFKLPDKEIDTPRGIALVAGYVSLFLLLICSFLFREQAAALGVFVVAFVVYFVWLATWVNWK